ncbi:unnamed protein product [Closterium sp. Yama58-4]|nr:unnamed protein product [Closterium sp. Yama58-4]
MGIVPPATRNTNPVNDVPAATEDRPTSSRIARGVEAPEETTRGPQASPITATEAHVAPPMRELFVSDVAELGEDDMADAPSVASSDETADELDVRIALAYICRKYFFPNTAITVIIRLFKSMKWAASDLHFWESFRDLEEFEREFAPGDEAWEAVDLELAGDFGTITFRYRPIIRVRHAVLLKIWARMSGVDGFATRPIITRGEDKVRRYTSPVDTNWFHQATEELKGKAIVAGILLFSDSTHLTFNGRQFAHPLRMTLINIPEAFRWLLGGSETIALFPALPSDMSAEQKTAVVQQMLKIVLGPIMEVSTAESGGVQVMDHTGREYTVIPMLSIWACDHPESSKITCTMAASSNKPCSMCTVSRWDLAKVTAALTPRTVADQKLLFEDMARCTPEERALIKKAWSTHYVACALWEWGYVTKQWGNLYEAIGVCVLHAVDEGMNARILAGETPGSVLRVPNVVTYFRTLARYAAWEHQSMMQIVPLLMHLPGREDVGRAMVMFNDWYRAYFKVPYHTEASLTQCIAMSEELVDTLVRVFPNQKSHWLLIKVHEIAHLPDLIRSRGMPQEYSTNMGEHSHKTEVKCHARNSNWRDVGRDIAVRHERLAAIKELTKDDGGGKSYETAMRLAIDRNERVLTKTFRRMNLGAPLDPAWTSYELALGEEVMGKFNRELARSQITVTRLQVHIAMAIPPHDRMDRGDHGQLVKAAPEERKFSHIRIEGGGAVWFGRVLVLFQFTGPDGNRIQRAFIKYYDEVEPRCAVTGCQRLLPTSGVDEYAVIELESILCLAHIVPSFVDPQFFLVNRFLF